MESPRREEVEDGMVLRPNISNRYNPRSFRAVFEEFHGVGDYDGVPIVGGFAEGLKSISTVEHPFLFVLQTIGIWACYFVMLHVMFFAFDPTAHLGILAALIVFVFGSLGMLIPSPGGMGAYHFLISEGLQLNGVGSTDGFTFANILFFSIQVGITLICGILALVAMPIINKK